ncbi:beta-glucan synthesis-associated [Violaceomyces palustris]|uniref:Beta-glucan synthesis-associated n=1 Tax=Violaceomyces palustris TaxID=1673888 RepID=A0ACD0P3L9_9BASI|nr:beta-glucan synthesis-associated [Violaceomyces palustris]
MASSTQPNHGAAASEISSHVGGSEFGPYSHLRKDVHRQKGYGNAPLAPGNPNQRGGSSSDHSSSQRYVVTQNSLLDGKEAEPDDYLHNPDPNWDKSSHGFSWRGFFNILTLILLGLALVMLFAGYPIIANVEKIYGSSTKGGYNLGGTNGSGQVPDLPIRALIDPDTDEQFRKINIDGAGYHLVFSDEFNQEGRTFWPGDDPYWEAVDIYYAATHDFEWYSPEAVNTSDGALLITMEAHPTHNLNFRSGMVQSWNKFCFQGGYIEFSIKQPGSATTRGYWPAAWLMGNLGRPGYLGSTHGMWPYSYQSCDTGILENQTFVNGSGPVGAIKSTATYALKSGQLSQLPGMRTSACTCPGQDHPGPNNNVGRSSPELDILEAQIQTHNGETHSFASQSVQTAPFDFDYQWSNATGDASIYDESITTYNSYVGSPLQEAVSGVTQIPDRGFFDAPNPDFVTFGLAYSPDWDGNGNGYVTWYVDGKPSWTVKGSAIGPSARMDVGQRTIPTEPMSIIMNLGIASGFQPVDFGEGGVKFPAYMAFDYVRVYQPDGQADRLSCDPPDHPTADYINKHLDMYMNPNLTTWTQVYDWPKNKLKDGC